MAESNTSAARVKIETNKGAITLELNAEKAPVTVANFFEYVKAGFYSDTIFHRVIDGFMIQGGGMLADMQPKATIAAIKNEAANGLKNVRGSIAMARTSDPDSATAQFFINTVDNDFLNASPGNAGYAVFGQVVDGMDTVDAISSVATGSGDVPSEPIVISSVTVVK